MVREDNASFGYIAFYDCLYLGLCVADVRLSAYSKLLLASQEQVLSLLAEERAVLQIQLSLEKDDPQACFIQSALLQLQVYTHCWALTGKPGGNVDILYYCMGKLKCAPC